MTDRVAIVLAAGHARRFGADKLSQDFRGEPLLVHAIRIAEAAPVERVIVVARPGTLAGAVEIASDAQSDSLRAGLEAAGGVSGAFIFLGDMPLVPEDMAGRLAEAIGDGLAARPMFEGRPGHPVLLSREGMRLAQAIEGDCGLGPLLRGRAGVIEVPTEDAGVVADVDTVDDLSRLG